MIEHFETWDDIEWCAIDVETTGLDPERCRVVEVAVVRMRGGQVTSRFCSLVNPGCAIPLEASRIHGISTERVASAPRFIDVVPDLARMTRGAMPLAYNESFDRAFLFSELARVRFDRALGCAAFSGEWPAWMDPLTWVRQIDRGLGKVSHKLTDACARWQVRLEDAHRAESDAEAAGKLLWELRSMIGRFTPSEMIRRQQALYREREEWYASQRARKNAAPPRDHARG